VKNNGMKIALIYPRYRGIAAGGMEEPLGILYIASALTEAGHHVIFTDLTFEDNLNILRDKVSDVDLIGISSSSPLFGKAIKVLSYVKEINPEALCLIGGSHPTAMPEDALRAGFDYAVLGEGERTVVDFVNFLSKGKHKNTKGIAFLKNGHLHINEPMPYIEDLDNIPFPDRSLIDYSRYGNLGILATRGCPYNCFFCKPMLDMLFGKRVRKRSAASMVEEIERITKSYPRKSFHFKDDTLTVLPTTWFEEFRKELRKRGLNIRWQANSRVDSITTEKLRLMKEAGCSQISFGVESGSPKILKFYNKHRDPGLAVKAFEACHKIGIMPNAYVMLGAPIETIEDMELTYSLIKKIKPVFWRVFTVTPFPGNYLYKYAKERNLINISDYEQYDNALNSIRGISPMKLKYLTVRDINKYRDKINRYLIFSGLFKQGILRTFIKKPAASIKRFFRLTS
jgi:anaerobic magnesium-protoporphyrin IX monomethyl ester cyclase